jgi:hypothetical protein
MTKKDQDNLAKLYMESYDGDDDENNSEGLDRALALAKDYFSVNDEKYKKMIESEINTLIYNTKADHDSSYETEELISQIKGIMQHGSSEQDDYNAENEYERRRENWGSMSAGDMYGDY